MASVTTDPRNGNVIVRAYAGLDPATRKKRYLRETLEPHAREAEIVLACARLDEKAAFMKETGRTLTLDDLIVWYLEELEGANRPNSTVNTYRSKYFRHISPRRGDMPADALMPFMVTRDLAAAVRGEVREPISPSTANGVRDLLHAAYTAAFAEGVVDRNPIAAVPKLTVDDAEDVRVFGEREFPVLVDWMGSPSVDWTEAVVKAASSLALDTGLRVGEACGLRPRDHRKMAVRVAGSVTEAGGLHRKATKSGRKRTVSLDEGADGRLTDFEDSKRALGIKDGDRIFCDADGREMKPSAISAAFSAACYDLGLGEGRRFHELRHTHATWLLESGVSLKVVSERLGHASESFTLRTYGHVLPGRDLAAAAEFGELRQGMSTRGRE